MENQHRLIRGYRDLDANEIDLINEIKGLSDRLGQLLSKVVIHVSEQEAAADDVHGERHAGAQPMRWVAIARTDLQTGIMALVRAVAQPTSF